MLSPASRSAALATSALALGALLAAAAPAHAAPAHPRHAPISRHVLLISVDGLHQSDLAWWVSRHPSSALAGLVRTGSEFTAARTPFPSDSFPGMVGQVTGGDPRTTGIYYDVTYNRALLPPGTTDCADATPGTTVAFDETVDKDNTRLDAGQGLAGLPGSILAMTGKPGQLIDPAALPVDPTTCTPVLPHQYLKVNTVFEVAKAHGLRTAWSDKHPAYEILNGPSGTGIDDEFTPEINSTADSAGDDWTDVNTLTQQYDDVKVRAVLNEIAGYDHSGTHRVGAPAIFGMNFQTVSTAEKLAVSGGQAGGYLPDGTPGPVLTAALADVDHEIGRMVTALHRDGLYGSTTVILSAKHGQSPQDGASLTRIDDGAVLSALDAAWEQAGHPGPLVAGSLDDDGMLLWLTEHTQAAADFAKAFLLSYAGDGTGADGQAKATGLTKAPKPYTAAGLSAVYAGSAAAALIGVPVEDPRVPDVIGIAQHGTVYTGGTKKIAEHGGADPQDRDVPLLVAGPRVRHQVNATPVETTAVAPTILTLLGLDPSQLQAVQQQGTRALPVR